MEEKLDTSQWLIVFSTMFFVVGFVVGYYCGARNKKSVMLTIDMLKDQNREMFNRLSEIETLLGE